MIASSSEADAMFLWIVVSNSGDDSAVGDVRTFSRWYTGVGDEFYSVRADGLGWEVSLC